MKKFVELRAKTYSYLIDGGSKYKKSKRNKNVCKKTNLKFENYKNWLEATQLKNRIIYLKMIKLE